MADQNIDSLIYAVDSSKTELERLVGVLKHTNEKKIDHILRAIQKTSATLSSALARLSNHVDDLPDPPKAKVESEQIDAELLRAITIALKEDKTPCKFCGGELPPWSKDAQKFAW